jgi:TRAP-type C4-dicarboxylate transport system permease small subunit
MMKTQFNIVRFISKVLSHIAGIALTVMMLLTVADVALRTGGYPFVGTYEIVSLLFAIVIAFGIPQVSLDKGNVLMEFLLERLSQNGRNVMNTATRVLCLILFVFIGYNLFIVGAVYHASGEVSPTIKIPFYPVVYGVGVCCLLECFVFLFDIVRIWRGQYE